MPAILGAGAARSLGKMKDCPICFGIGWVCEITPTGRGTKNSAACAVLANEIPAKSLM